MLPLKYNIYLHFLNFPRSPEKEFPCLEVEDNFAFYLGGIGTELQHYISVTVTYALHQKEKWKLSSKRNIHS